MTQSDQGEYIYWNGEQAVETEDVQEAFKGLFVIDLDFKRPHMRYGNWKTESGWKHVPFDDFPVEFRMALLILGVT